MPVELRAATEADIEALLALWRRATHPSVSDDAESLRTLLARDPHAVLVAADGEDLVGSVIGGFDGWRASIHRIAVDPSWRRQGVASRLLSAVEARFRAVGARRCQAIVISTDEDAMAFWRSTTWTEDDDRARFVLDDPR